MRILILILEFSSTVASSTRIRNIFETAYFLLRIGRPYGAKSVTLLTEMTFSKPPQGGLKAMLQGTIRNDDFKRNTVLQCCYHSKQCRNNVATLCCAKNRHCESSRVTSP